MRAPRSAQCVRIADFLSIFLRQIVGGCADNGTEDERQDNHEPTHEETPPPHLESHLVDAKVAFDQRDNEHSLVNDLPCTIRF